ncbi:MAG: polysulfide reductase NrfD [Proteobacteria bacterium]|jgi:molybdopterin-containing oxidoreductase family membrane subunit|nr:polysulfide reductase NrfD [Pseudomonadota bacterium]
MLEKALHGARRYWGWIALLLLIVIAGFISYLVQLREGLGITGMSRDVSWGLYIANFTFLVGVAASAVMVVLPYYLHNYKQFGKITVLGEFLAVSAVIMSIMFIFVDLGQPSRVFNVIFYPSPSSLLFWDMIVLTVYLILNLLIGWYTLDAEHKEEPVPAWVKPLIILSIPWAISIHTVTAFIYSGLGARAFWLTALLAPRFLASAFASGPALLIIICIIIKKVTRFDPGKEAIQKVAQIVTYAMLINVFFLMVEFFTVYYSKIPEHIAHSDYLLFGLEGHMTLVPYMWVSIILMFISLILLINPGTRKNENILVTACLMVFLSIWIDKGLNLLIPGFTPSPLNEIFKYRPTLPEVLITLGIYAIGFLILTILFKIAIEMKLLAKKQDS